MATIIYVQLASIISGGYLLKKLISLFALGSALLLPHAAHAQQYHPHWTQCTITATSERCVRYEMPRVSKSPTGHWHSCQPVPAGRVCTTFPTFWTPKPRVVSNPIVRTVPQSVTPASPAGLGSRPMLVTYYLATGSPMANGVYPSVGWAACGYDLRLGERVFVPGIGSLTCGDRIGYQPWNHIDVFGVPLGTSWRNVTVLS